MLPEQLSYRLWAFAARTGKLVNAFATAESNGQSVSITNNQSSIINFQSGGRLRKKSKMRTHRPTTDVWSSQTFYPQADSRPQVFRLA
jgi:hypothetical protein